jgi:hypothetical protein
VIDGLSVGDESRLKKSLRKCQQQKRRCRLATREAGALAKLADSQRAAAASSLSPCNALWRPL